MITESEIYKQQLRIMQLSLSSLHSRLSMLEIHYPKSTENIKMDGLSISEAITKELMVHYSKLKKEEDKIVEYVATSLANSLETNLRDEYLSAIQKIKADEEKNIVKMQLKTFSEASELRKPINEFIDFIFKGSEVSESPTLQRQGRTLTKMNLPKITFSDENSLIIPGQSRNNEQFEGRTMRGRTVTVSNFNLSNLASYQTMEVQSKKLREEVEMVNKSEIIESMGNVLAVTQQEARRITQLDLNLVKYMGEAIDEIDDAQLSKADIRRMKYAFLKTRTRDTREFRIEGVSRNSFVALKSETEGIVGHTAGGLIIFKFQENGTIHQKQIAGQFGSIIDVVYMSFCDCYFAFDRKERSLIKIDGKTHIATIIARNMRTINYSAKQLRAKGAHLLVNQGDQLTLLDKIEEGDFTSSLSYMVDLNASRIIDFELLTEDQFIYTTLNGYVSVLDFEGNVYDGIELSDFEGRVMALTVSGTGSNVAISTDDWSCNQKDLYWLELDEESEIFEVARIPFTDTKCFWTIAFLNATNNDTPILYGIEHSGAHTIYSFYVEDDQIKIFSQAQKNFHPPTDYVRHIIEAFGFVWSIDNSGVINRFNLV